MDANTRAVHFLWRARRTAEAVKATLCNPRVARYHLWCFRSVYAHISPHLCARSRTSQPLAASDDNADSHLVCDMQSCGFRRTPKIRIYSSKPTRIYHDAACSAHNISACFPLNVCVRARALRCLSPIYRHHFQPFWAGHPLECCGHV